MITINVTSITRIQIIDELPNLEVGMAMIYFHQLNTNTFVFVAEFKVTLSVRPV